jgi:hypothetical protein
MTADQIEQSGPSCFLEVLDIEYERIRRRLKIYILRWHLARYPVDLLPVWWRKERGMPHATSQRAFESYKNGEKPGALYKGPPDRPKLRVIEGGNSRRVSP